MNTTYDDAELPSSLAARLRNEARATRPDFSDGFHARLMDRVARNQVSLPSRDNGVVKPPSTWRGRLTMPIAAAAAFAAVLTVLFTGSGPEEAPNGSVSFQPVDVRSVDEPPALGVESLPMYDDIDAGMRAGVWMLASSLVEMPDWATLANFGDDAESRDAQGR